MGGARGWQKEEKECPKKGVLGRDIKSSSTGVTRRGPSLSAKALPLPLYLRLSRPLPSLSLSLLTAPLCALLVPLPSPLPGLPRENPLPFVKGDPTKSPGESHVRAKGLKGVAARVAAGRGGGRRRTYGRLRAAGEDHRHHTRQTARPCTHLALYATDAAENPLKRSTRNKGHPSRAPALSVARHIIPPGLSRPPPRVHERPRV